MRSAPHRFCIIVLPEVRVITSPGRTRQSRTIESTTQPQYRGEPAMTDRGWPRQRQAVVRSRVETLPEPPQDREKRRPEQTDTLCAPLGPDLADRGRWLPSARTRHLN